MSDKKSSGNKKIKKRHWAFFVWVDSAPVDWIEQLQKTGLPCAISPLHEKDLKEDNSGELKKPHWHVIVSYSGPTTYNVVKTLTENLNTTIPQPLESVRGYYRYFTHMDNPDKHQYDEKDIQTINGFNIADFVDLTKSEVNQIKKRLQILIRDKEIIEYSSFMDYLLDSEMDLEYDIASSNTYFFDKYIASCRHRAELPPPKSDPKTGEVIE